MLAGGNGYGAKSVIGPHDRRLAAVVLLLVLLWAAYQLRVRQLATQFNKTLEARVSERIDKRSARERSNTVRHVFSREETVPRVQHAPLLTDAHLEPAGSDVRRLSMDVVMNRTDRPFVELDAHHHEVVAVAEYLPADAGRQRVPRRFDTERERGSPTGHRTRPLVARRRRRRRDREAAVPLDWRMMSFGSRSCRTGGCSP